MNTKEVIHKAKELGFTDVQTAAGWIPLDEWNPYGKKDSEWIDFYILDDEIHEQMNAKARILENYPGITGIWPLGKFQEDFDA